jgi:HK97 gp10 family phage protein
MPDLVHVKGLSDLQKLLDTLPAKMEANVMRGALRAGAKVVLAEAKQNVPVDQGILRDGLKISTGTKKGVVKASIKAKGKHGYLAHWMEYGTKPHKIKAGEGSLFYNAAHVEEVDHPGVSPRPFLRPALDSQAGQALAATGEYIKSRLAKKHGIDTSDISIGDDEE